MSYKDRFEYLGLLVELGHLTAGQAVRLLDLLEPTAKFGGVFDPFAYPNFGVGPSKPADPKPKTGDVLKVKCKKCGNEGHVTVWKVADGKVHATCKLCGKEVVQ